MLLNINGKPEEVKIKSNLAELILSKGLCAEKVVIEHNLRIVPRQEWNKVFLGENDNIEIVSFVGGGTEPPINNGDSVIWKIFWR